MFMNSAIESSVWTIKRVSVVEQAIKSIYNLIRDSNLKANDYLPPERELSEMLGISRNSLREAIRVLDMLGIIRVEQGNGMVIDATRVSDSVTRHLSFALLLNRDKLFELFETRMFIETELAGLAAERANPEEIKELESTYAKLVEYKADRAKGIQIEFKLHALTAKAAHNSVLESIFSSLRQVLLESRETTVPSSGVTPTTIVLQGKIVNAIALHDKVAAREYMREHLSAVAGRVQLEVEKRIADSLNEEKKGE